MWADVLLSPSVEVSFPVGEPPVPFMSNDTLTEFTQCDAGGKMRTPLITSGPQYFMRTLPSTVYYICSAVRGDVGFWWNESIAKCGAEEIISVNYLYDTTRSTGAGCRKMWIDGTYGQANNKLMWTYCLDACNPESPTFCEEEGQSLYNRSVAVQVQGRHDVSGLHDLPEG